MLVERDNGLVTLTLNRPEAKNSINGVCWDELTEVIHEVTVNPDDRALMITGAGGNFSSGADLAGGGFTSRDPHVKRPLVESMRTMGDIMLSLHRLPKPTLAKVDGVAVGVGLGLALACDLVIASDRARFFEIFTKRGLALDGGNSWILPRIVGLQKAKELAFFGDAVSAEDAERIGLVNRVVPVDQLDAVAGEWARRLADGPTLALGLTKRMLNNSIGATFEQMAEEEARSQHITFTSKDMKEAFLAYSEKRDPTFRGE
jgi:2-(1,2-epoxy-1,2-dihydrophenyl)acetyl-CoA isomerase